MHLLRYCLKMFFVAHLQSPSESVPTHALSCCFITGSSSPTLAPLQAALPKGASWTRLFTVAPDVPRRTLTRPLDGIAESSVLTLALLTAARTPLFVTTGWKVREQWRKNFIFVFWISKKKVNLTKTWKKRDLIKIKHYHLNLHRTSYATCF